MAINPLLRRRGAVALLASGGAIGPALFVATWAALGTIRKGYSPIADPISRLAALGSWTRPAMTAGMIVDGAGITAYGIALEGSGERVAGRLTAASGLATLGVAAFPLGEPLSEKLHTLFAVAAYATLVGVPLASARTMWRSGARWRSVGAIALGVVTGGFLARSLAGGPRHGLYQRIGLTLADLWLIERAVVLARR